MGIINVLDPQVANLIAAGEVVERPASAVKELLENAIDAGATRITVEIKQGGVALMRITDNGCGMSREDALLCISRHATSKIRAAKDLDGIATLGFRGEALAAIASVSRLRIMTRQADSDSGVTVETLAGKVLSAEESGCPVGTTILVEELFANVPARRKFLKRDASETAAVAATVEKIALSRPDIAIRFLADGALRFETPGDGDLLHVIYAVLGREFAKKTIPVHDMTEGIEVVGVIGIPDNVRGNRGAENFFINGRYVRCGTAAAALEQAFHTYIPSDKFPACVLALNLHPAYVDVNVHPQKMEVKFSNDKPVFNAVYCAVKNVLSQRMSRPTMPSVGEGTHLTGDSYKLYADVLAMKTDTEEEAEAIASEKERLRKKYEQVTIPSESRATELPDLEIELPKVVLPNRTGAPSATEREPFRSERPERTPESLPSRAVEPSVPTEEPKRTVTEPTEAVQEREKELADRPREAVASSEKKAPLPWFRVAGVAFNCYVFVEMEDKMLVIDKHAAHERVLFEQMRENMSRLQPASQLLFLPLEVSLTTQEIEAAEAYNEELLAVGFAFAVEKPQTASIVQYPSGLNEGQAAAMFAELAARLSEGQGDLKIGRDQIYERALFQASCKAAVKAGREDTPETIRWIAEQVIGNPKVRYCPHGRPVAFEMTKGQFERQFERT